MHPFTNVLESSCSDKFRESNERILVMEFFFRKLQARTLPLNDSIADFLLRVLRNSSEHSLGNAAVLFRPWESSCSISQPATLLKVTVLHACFSRFLNCTNCTKRATHHKFKMIMYSSNPFKGVFKIILSAYKDKVSILQNTPSRTYTFLWRVHRIYPVLRNYDFVGLISVFEICPPKINK